MMILFLNWHSRFQRYRIFIFPGKILRCHSLTLFCETRYIFFSVDIFFFCTHSLPFVPSGIFFFSRIIDKFLPVSFFCKKICTVMNIVNPQSKAKFSTYWLFMAAWEWYDIVNYMVIVLLRQYCLVEQVFVEVVVCSSSACWWYCHCHCSSEGGINVCYGCLPPSPHPSQLTKYKISYDSETKMLNYQQKSS